MRSDLDEIYRDLRPYAFAIAYRMLGSVSEAEDVVQDAFVRLAQAGDERIRSPQGLRGHRDHPARHRRASLSPGPA